MYIQINKQKINDKSTKSIRKNVNTETEKN